MEPFYQKPLFQCQKTVIEHLCDILLLFFIIFVFFHRYIILEEQL